MGGSPSDSSYVVGSQFKTLIRHGLELMIQAIGVALLGGYRQQWHEASNLRILVFLKHE